MSANTKDKIVLGTVSSQPTWEIATGPGGRQSNVVQWCSVLCMTMTVMESILASSWESRQTEYSGVMPGLFCWFLLCEGHARVHFDSFGDTCPV